MKLYFLKLLSNFNKKNPKTIILIPSSMKNYTYSITNYKDNINIIYILAQFMKAISLNSLYIHTHNLGEISLIWAIFPRFLHSLAPVLHKDPTVLGITALNYNSYVFTADSLTTFYRTDRPHHLALLLPARSVHELLVNHWPHATSVRIAFFIRRKAVVL